MLRIQAGDEAIKIILYMVIYLKLNPTYEGAINFAITHVKGPITNDMRKAMWDLQVGKYRTIEEALSAYMPKWAVWNEDFVRSLTLLYGTLRETEERREETLRRALNYILQSTHERMKVYVEEISSPLKVIHILGLMLPAIGLIMFPMVAIFLHEQIKISQLIFGYLVVLPLLNLFFIYRVLMKRPSAFMVPDISKHPDLPKEGFFSFKLGRTKFFVPILLLSILLGLLLMIPGIFHFTDLAVRLAAATPQMKEAILKNEATLNFQNLASSFSITAGVAAMAISFFYLSSFQRKRIRDEIKNIESEFRVGLFSLGNFLLEGYPIEAAIEKNLEEYKKLGMEKRPIYGFFTRLLANIRNLSMTFKRALFDEKHGLLKHYPSVLIDNIMKVLSDASEKSSILLGSVAKTIGGYLENVHAIEAKIKELLEDTRSSIKLQAGFVIPLICGIIGSLTIYILEVLRILADKLAEIEKSLGLGVLTGGSNLIDALVGGFKNLIPMTAVQATIGIYTVEIVILMSMLLSGIENGFDKVARDYTIAQTLIRAILIYGIVSVLALILFTTLRIAVGGA